jgi:hypothetical protein
MEGEDILTAVEVDTVMAAAAGAAAAGAAAAGAAAGGEDNTRNPSI